MMRRAVALVVGIAMVVGLTVYVTQFGLTLHPFAPTVTARTDPRPAVLHAIRSANQRVTAERQVDQEITKSATSRLPGSNETITYLAT